MIQSKDDYKRYISYEEEKMRDNYPNWTWELNQILKFLKLYRKYEYYYNCSKNFIYLKYLERKYHKYVIKYGFNLPINTIEEGLRLIHFGHICIHPDVKIGKDVRIHPMVTIGKKFGNLKEEKLPVIKDGVWIGPGVRIYGEITIGNNAVLGANSIVNKDISDNVTVAGSPAKIINKKGYRDYYKKMS